MSFLEYHVESKQVVEIHDQEPLNLQTGCSFAASPDFNMGDEFEQTIWVNEVDSDKNLTSFSAIRNNPNAKRLLRENTQLKQENIANMLAMTEMYEQNLRLEKESADTMIALTEMYEMMLEG